MSAGRTWSFTLNGATSFAFSVYVVAEVPSETGLLRLEQVEGLVTDFTIYGVWQRGSTVLAFSDPGTILRSIDGGATWGFATNPLGRYLQSAWGDGSFIVAVGGNASSSVIIRSEDGGATWTGVSSGTSDNLYGVAGAGSTVVGYGGTIRRSTDGGATWHALQPASDPNFHLYGIWMLDPLNAVAVGDAGVIVRGTR